jgi:hypothetical protein
MGKGSPPFAPAASKGTEFRMTARSDNNTLVLVVEDDVLNRQGVVLYLQMNGYLPL